MLKKIIAGIAGLTFAFSVVVSSGTLQTKAMETTTETTAEETTDTDGSEVPMTIRVLDESPNDEMYLSGVAFQVTLDETGEIIQQFVYDGGDFTFPLQYDKTYTVCATFVPEGYQLKKQGFYVEVSGYASMDYTFRAKNPSITTTYTTTTDPNMTTDESFTESTTATTATKKSETSPVQTTVTTEMDHYRYTGTTGTSRPRLTSGTTETTVSKHDDTDIIEVPMTIRVLDESPNDEMYLPGVAFQVISEETGEVIHQFVYDGGDFSFLLEYGKPYTIYAVSLPEGYQLQNEGVYVRSAEYEMDYTFRAKNPSITTTYTTTTDPNMSTADSTETTSAKSSVTTATTKPRTTETTARTTPDDYEYTGTSGTTTPDWLHSQTTTESTTANSTTPDWMNSQTTTENTATNSTTPDIDKIPCGDINMDRRIDLCDAVLLNKYCAGVVSFNSIAKEKSDCNQDGTVDAADSLLLLKFLLRMVENLPGTSTETV